MASSFVTGSSRPSTSRTPPTRGITGINPEGHIVGFYFNSDGSQHGFVLKRDRYISIDIPGATATEANGIDPQGNVVGQYVTPDGHTHGYFLLDPTHRED